MDDPSGARRSADQATKLGASASAVDAVKAEIDAASPLPRSGWSGHLTALGGWDSNPAQSGLGSSSNVDYDASDPEHDTDYGNYSFTQHLILAGVTGRFF